MIGSNTTITIAKMLKNRKEITETTIVLDNLYRNDRLSIIGCNIYDIIPAIKNGINILEIRVKVTIIVPTTITQKIVLSKMVPLLL